MTGGAPKGRVVAVHGRDRRSQTFTWCGNAPDDAGAILRARRAVRMSWAAATAAMGAAGEPLPEELALGEKVTKRPDWTIDAQWHPREAILKAASGLRPQGDPVALDPDDLPAMAAALAMTDPRIGPAIAGGGLDAEVLIGAKGFGTPPHVTLRSSYHDGPAGTAHPSQDTEEALLALATVAAIHDPQHRETLARKRAGAPKSAILRATLARNAEATRRDLVAPAAAMLRRLGLGDLALAVEAQCAWRA